MQVGQARGGLLQQGDGLQAEVGKVLLLHVLQRDTKVGSPHGAPGTQLLSTLLSLSLFKNDSILFRKILPEGFCFN